MLMHDYKHFKFDVNMIRNELNDPDTKTPFHFPEILLDEIFGVKNVFLFFIYYY